VRTGPLTAPRGLRRRPPVVSAVESHHDTERGSFDDKQELLERYEALGEESDFLGAKPLYERAAAGEPDARVLSDYGYLLYAHARRELREAVELYERAIELDPRLDKPHYQLIGARAALEEPELAVALRTTACGLAWRAAGASLFGGRLPAGARPRAGAGDGRGGARGGPRRCGARRVARRGEGGLG